MPSCSKKVINLGPDVWAILLYSNMCNGRNRSPELISDATEHNDSIFATAKTRLTKYAVWREWREGASPFRLIRQEIPIYFIRSVFTLHVAPILMFSKAINWILNLQMDILISSSNRKILRANGIRFPFCFYFYYAFSYQLKCAPSSSVFSTLSSCVLLTWSRATLIHMNKECRLHR